MTTLPSVSLNWVRFAELPSVSLNCRFFAVVIRELYDVMLNLTLMYECVVISPRVGYTG